MTQWHGPSRRKPSGGRHRPHRKKRRGELGSDTQPTTIGDDQQVKVRTRGGNDKVRVVSVENVSVTDPGSGDASQAEVESVVENPANPHYVRRNLITKGAIIQTDQGRARVTSRPGQDGTVNAVLIED